MQVCTSLKGNLLLTVQSFWSCTWHWRALRGLTWKDRDKLEQVDTDESKETAPQQKTAPAIPGYGNM